MNDQKTQDHEGDAKTLSPLLPQDVEDAAATLLEAAGRGDELVEQHRRRLSRLLF